MQTSLSKLEKTSQIAGWDPCCVVANVLDCDIVESEFELE